MSFSQHLVLWLHVAFVIFTIGPVTMAIMSTPRYMRKQDIPILRFLTRMTFIFAIASLGVLIAGFGLASMISKAGKPWIIVSATLFVVAVLLLALIHRDQRHAIKALEADAATAAAAAAVPAVPDTPAGPARQAVSRWTVMMTRTGLAELDEFSPFPPIADYGFLSDCEVAALIAPSGSVEWMCLPRLDDPSVFGAMLDRDAGWFKFGPADMFVPADRRYLAGTMVLETVWDCDEGWLIVRDCLLMGPWRHQHPQRAAHRRPPTAYDADHTLLRTVP